MEDNYHRKSHSKYLIKLHFVFAIKYRKPILVEELNDDILELTREICTEKHWIIDAVETDKDHIHILLDIPPTVSAYEIARRIKQLSTYRIYQKHRTLLKKYFWKENTFWSDGYFVCSTGNASTETIRKYIEEQG